MTSLNEYRLKFNRIRHGIILSDIKRNIFEFNSPKKGELKCLT